jgi:hypothetical protein
VIHGADEAAGTALLLLAPLSLESTTAAISIVAELVAIAVAESACAAAAVVGWAGYVAGILYGTLTVAVAELLFPALGWSILLLTGVGL